MICTAHVQLVSEPALRISLDIITCVDDIVEGVIRTLDRPAALNPAWNAEAPENSSSYAPYRVYNIGNNESVKLLEFVETLEKIIDKPAIRKLLPMQAGDVLETRRHFRAPARRRFRAVDAHRGRPRSFRRMVPKLSRRVIAESDDRHRRTRRDV